MTLSSEDSLQRQLEAWLTEYGGPDVCVAELLCDRHAKEPGRKALHYENAAGVQVELSFADLRNLSARFAGVLHNLGVSKGDRVAVLLPRTPELMVAVLALWRLGAVHVPLFTAFGPEAVGYRLSHSDARIIVTNTTNRFKLQVPGLTSAPAVNKSVEVVTVEDHTKEKVALPAGDTPFWASLKDAQAVQEAATFGPDDPFVLIYTSGTTGSPKGAICSTKFLAMVAAYMRLGLNVQEDDVYWNMADPGWAYGLAFALIGPLLIGRPTIFVNAPFAPQLTYDILCRYQVTNFVAAPTAYRALRAFGVPPGTKDQFSIRTATSCGEPLNPEVITWAVEHLGIPIHDHYGQTEAGMPIVNHHHSSLKRPLRPGSMGRASLGTRVVILDDTNRELGPGQEGQVALDTWNSPLFYFRGYHQDPERTAERFVAEGRYYLTGDIASRDAADYFFFTSRTDDVIKSAAYRIGPFEVESALLQHQAVAETAAVAKRDCLKGNIVKAFVVLKSTFTGSEALASELGQFVKARLGAHAYPREIEFVDQLPKTSSGKIQRFLLRNR